ncbi:glycosyltransferase family 4 protein [Nioella aestuarii]|uniref:glycosyltransferase family 4 protein n=1 Tax=Nioella aestuarii TaxID=1662864 RepID=UPI003D7F727E
MTPVTVLPSAANNEYLEEFRSKSAAVEILPQLWRHRFRDVSKETIGAVRNMIRRYQPAEVHVNTLVLDAPLIAARSEGCPSVVHVRELPAQDPMLCRILGDSARGLRRRILAQADRFIANSPAVADWLDVPDRVTLRLNEIDDDLSGLEFSPLASLRIALVSSNIAKKGIGDFIEIAKLVAQEEEHARIPHNTRCKFVLIGPDSADLQALGQLPANVEKAGYAPSPVAAMEKADVVLILSKFAESFGRTALEAMAAGRPVICYDRGTPASLIVSGKTGFSVPPDDLAAVTRAVLAFSCARIGLHNISNAARKRARELRASGPDAAL